MIEFDSVTKLYGLVNGVNDISMKLTPGAHGLLGPNGSGKTTMINLLTGQLRPSMGSVKIFGKDPWGKEEMLGRIGLCPAVDVLHSNVTAYQWVQFQTRMIGYPWAEAEQRTLDALAEVGMSDALHRKIGGYSLGMRQRTKLAQAIAHEPDLLILDEPFNGLDPIGRQDMTDFMIKYIARGKSVILASHVLHEVEAINPSLLLLSNGRLLAQGPPSEIREVMPQLVERSQAKTSQTETSHQRQVELFIRCNDNYRLAQQLFARVRLSTVSLSKDESELTIATRAVSEIFQHLPEIVENESLEVFEMRANDGSLDDLFSSLMKLHRGTA